MARNMRLVACCVAIGFASCVTSSPFYKDDQLYEGSSCRLVGKKGAEGEGKCVKLEECPSKVAAIRKFATYDIRDRCGFNGFEEIVCCSLDIARRLNPPARPAEAACQEYGNEVVSTERAVSFHILGGVEAGRNEFPHMAALGYLSSPEDDEPGSIKYNCGGTLISQQHVLTAAHCVSNVHEAVPVEVKLGCTDLTVNNGETQRIQVDTVTPHPDYRRSQNYHDIAVIKLKDPVRLTSSVQPTCLATKPLTSYEGFESNNGSLVVIGWGQTSLDGDNSNKLMKAAGLAYIERNNCSSSYSRSNARLPRGIDNTMICALDLNRDRRADACLGDSGGPLLFSAGPRAMLAGITAFGQACGSSVPGVYVSVYDYLNWIESVVWPSEDNQQSVTFS